MIRVLYLKVLAFFGIESHWQGFRPYCEKCNDAYILVYPPKRCICRTCYEQEKAG